MDDLFKYLDIDKGEWLEDIIILSVEIVHQLQFCLVLCSGMY